MANVVQLGKRHIYIKLDGTNDFNFATATFTTGVKSGLAVSTVFPDGLSLTEVVYSPPSAGAVGVWREDSLTGVLMPRFRGITGDTLTRYLEGNTFYKPCLEHDDQTTDTNAEWWFIFNNHY